MRCVNDGLVNQRHSAHGCLQQHTVGVCDVVGQLDETELGIDLDQQHHVLPAVLNELLEVIVVELIQRAFILCLLLAHLILADGIQTIAVHLVIGMLAIQLQIIQVAATNQVIGNSLAAIALVFSLLGILVPQAHACCL